MKKGFLLVFLASAGALVVPALAAPVGISPIVSRAEAVKVLVDETPALRQRLQTFRYDLPPIALFDDVPQYSNLAPYIEVAFEHGLITGNEERLFRPTHPITESELVMLHARMVASADPVALSGLSNLQLGEAWYNPALRILQAHGLETPKPFSPASPARRASVAHMSHQVLAYVASQSPAIVASESSVSANVEPEQPTITNVPQFLPIRQLQPLTASENGTSIVAGQDANIAVAASPSVENNGTSIYAGSSVGSTVISGGNNGTATFIDAGSGGGGQVSAAQPTNTGGQAVMIDAGGAGNEAGAGTTTFTITIPKLGIGPLTVTNPEDPFTHNGLLAPLKNGVGHLFSTPGAGGKILVYGHSSSYPWDVSEYTKIFRRINELSPGDEIIVDYNGQQYRYQVSFEETVPAKDMSAYQDDGNGEDLILYTCWPPDSISQRYLVHAKPV